MEAKTANADSTPYTMRQNAEGVWIAHALAFDLVGADAAKDVAMHQLKVCLGAQIAFGQKQGLTYRQCYFPAPVEYWLPPYEYMPIPTQEELSAFKFSPAPDSAKEHAGRKMFEALVKMFGWVNYAAECDHWYFSEEQAPGFKQDLNVAFMAIAAGREAGWGQ